MDKNILTQLKQFGFEVAEGEDKNTLDLKSERFFMTICKHKNKHTSLYITDNVTNKILSILFSDIIKIEVQTRP